MQVAFSSKNLLSAKRFSCKERSVLQHVKYAVTVGIYWRGPTKRACYRSVCKPPAGAFNHTKTSTKTSTSTGALCCTVSLHALPCDLCLQRLQAEAPQGGASGQFVAVRDVSCRKCHSLCLLPLESLWSMLPLSLYTSLCLSS